MAQKIEELGSLVYWDLRDTNIKRTKLENIVNDSGLGNDILPKQRTPSMAFTKTIEYGKRYLASVNKQLMLRKLSDDTEMLVYSIVEESIKDSTSASSLVGRNATYTTLDEVAYDKDDQEVVILASTPEGLELKRLFNTLKDRVDHSEVRKVIHKVLRGAQGIRVAKTGRVYFVPTEFTPVVDALTFIVNSIGSSQMHAFTVNDSSSSTAALTHEVGESLERGIAVIQAQLDKFTEDTVRPGTLQKKIDEINELRARGEYFKSLLDVSYTAIDTKIDQAEQVVNKMLFT